MWNPFLPFPTAKCSKLLSCSGVQARNMPLAGIDLFYSFHISLAF